MTNHSIIVNILIQYTPTMHTPPCTPTGTRTRAPFTPTSPFPPLPSLSPSSHNPIRPTLQEQPGAHVSDDPCAHRFCEFAVKECLGIEGREGSRRHGGSGTPRLDGILEEGGCPRRGRAGCRRDPHVGRQERPLAPVLASPHLEVARPWREKCVRRSSPSLAREGGRKGGIRASKRTEERARGQRGGKGNMAGGNAPSASGNEEARPPNDGVDVGRLKRT